MFAAPNSFFTRKGAILPANTVAPAVTGTAQVGSTLSCTTGTWTGTAPITYTYQWQRVTTNLSGATSSTYVAVSGDVGSTLRCVVTATNAAGAVSANSNSTATVSAVPLPGQLWTWGDNTYVGQLGIGNLTSYSSPKQVGSLTTWFYTSCGAYSSVNVKSDGTLWTWGRNANGELGLNNTTDYSAPKQVGALTTWSKVGSSKFTGFAIKTNGTLWAWGAGYFGRTGLNNQTTYSSPVQVGTLTSWATISTSRGDHSHAIKTDGTLWAWGRNTNGALGLGDTINRSSPVQVGALTTWAKVSGSGYSSIAIKTDGTLWSWGKNDYGQLGLSNTTNYSSPKQVGALTAWSKVSNGYYCSFSIKTDGTLWSWGLGSSGQLGLGNSTNFSSPKQVGTLTDWTEVSGGKRHSMATKTDGTLWTWGRNQTFGQLGLGNLTSYNSPKQVGALTTWVRVSAGVYFSTAIKTP